MYKETKKEINDMLFLMERMDKHYTGLEVEALKESVEELDARDRKDMLPTQFFNMAEEIPGGTKSTIGYVSAANLNVPQVKKVNPDTNRMKNYDDWDSFGKAINAPGEIGGVIKFARYTLNWRGKDAMHSHYMDNYVTPVNAIRGKYGIAAITPQASPAQPSNPSPTNGLGAPNGGSLLGPGFFMQDTGGKDCHKVVQYFLIGKDGKILKWAGTKDGEVPVDVLKNYFKKSAPVGVADLRKMNATDETIERYCNEIAAVKFRYTRFNTGSIVYVITNINGEKLRFFNDNLSNDIKEINIDPQEFLTLAKHLYKIDDSQF